jgi:Iap family predicted aminopeptidase
LTDALVQTANKLTLPVGGVNVEQIGASSDAEQFAERKIPRITIHSFTQEAFNARIIHTSKDKLSAMRQTFKLTSLGNSLTCTKHRGKLRAQSLS